MSGNSLIKNWGFFIVLALIVIFGVSLNFISAKAAQGNDDFNPTFADVPLDHPYHDYIEVLYQEGYTSGCNTDPLMYCPEKVMNRAESSVFVERGIHGAEFDPPEPTEVIFADVGLDAWYANWVHGLWNDGYTSGCGTDPLRYCPDLDNTRAEGTVFYLRMMYGSDYQPPASTESIFTDVDEAMWYNDWVNAAYQAGIAEPCASEPELLFCPDEPLTRAVAAYMMVQAKDLTLPTPTPAPSTTAVPTNTPTPIIPSPTATQGTGYVYYVAPDGNDANPGTEDQPWRTPAKAAAAAQAGDTVLFRGGTYYGQLWPQNSGNPSDGWITFKAYPGEEPVIIDDAFYSRAINVIGVSFIEINGLTGVGAGANGHAIGIDNAHHVRILNCVARDSATSGIATANGLDYITIEGNRVYGNSNIGSYNGSGISIWNAGGSIYDNAPGYHIIIRDNLIYDNRNLTGTPTDGNGIILDNNDRGGTPDLQLPKTLIANNVIFHNGGKCIHVLNTSNVDIVHNSCYHNVETERLAEGCAGEINLQRTYSYSSAINIRVYNNIAYGRGGGTCHSGREERYAFQVWGGVEYESDYNLWYNGAVVQVGPNDIVADPLFRYPSIDPGKADFSLMSTSPAVDSGIDQFATAVPKDYLGVSRPQGEGFDRGAYE